MSVIQIWILIEIEAVRQELDFLLLAPPSGCLGFNIQNDPGPVRRAVLVKDDFLNGSFPEFPVVKQEAFGDGFIGQVLLHFGYVSHATPCQFLELFIVDVGAVHGKHVAIVKVRGLQHATVVSKDRVAPFCVGIPQRAPIWYEPIRRCVHASNTSCNVLRQIPC